MRENTRSDKAIQARNARYLKYVEKVSPRSGNLTALTKAFLIGGATCVIGELISNGLTLLFPDVGNEMIATYTSMILVTVAILFTGLGFYDVIARQGGAGSFLTIPVFCEESRALCTPKKMSQRTRSLPLQKNAENYNKKWLKTLDSRGTNIVYYIGKFARDLFGQGKLQASRMGL